MYLSLVLDINIIMMNSQKILYILPDIVYVAELLPTKKEYTFSIHSFRQINGQFMDDNEFVEANMAKLAEKLDSGIYQLVLPDYLFTNTIVGIKESSEAKVKTHIKEKLLPSLGIDEENFQIETFVLTQHSGEFKVQLSALEKMILAPFSKAIKGKNIEISSITPLSWTLKSIVSLEPSITVVQLGDGLFLAQQYIGLDQTIYIPVVDAENIVETVKTLKGAEPSIQTMYLLASELVEEKLRDGLANTLPIQQLAIFKEKETEMPSYVRQAIEACAKTMVIPDFILPKFELNNDDYGIEITQEKKSDVAQTVELKSQDEEELPTPAVFSVDENKKTVTSDIKIPSETEIEEVDDEIEEKTDENAGDVAKSETEIEEVSKTISQTDEEVELKKIKTEDDVIDMDKFKSFFSNSVNDEKLEENEKMQEKQKMIEKKETTKVNEVQKEAPKSIIKDNSGVSTMLKMFFIGLASFFATVGIGVGIGLGFLSFSGNKQEKTAPIVEVATPSPTLAPSPSPTPAPTVDKKSLKVLIVNATTKAGYAGKIATTLKSAGYSEAKTGNAKGNYDEGNYLLAKEDDKNLIDMLSKDLDLEISYKEDKNIEDPKSEYDLVLVLAQ